MNLDNIKMEKSYKTKEDLVSPKEFNDWITCDKKVRKIYENKDYLGTTLIYRFWDSSIGYFSKGDSSVSIKIEGDTEETVKDVCSLIETNFF